MTMEQTTHEASSGDERPLVLLAIEPRSYAEAIGGTIAELRPGIDVIVAESRHLPEEGTLWTTAVVFCPAPRPQVLHPAVRWVQFAPYDEPEVVRVDGRAERFPGLGLRDLLGIVDRLAV